jgi:hypothetical protein
MNSYLKIYFLIQFFQTGFSITTLICFPYEVVTEYRTILLLFIITCFTYTSYFLMNIINFFKTADFQNFIDNHVIFSSKILNYILAFYQIFFTIILIGNNKICQNDTIKFINTFLFLTNIFYILILIFVIKNVNRSEPTHPISNTELIIKGRSVNMEIDCPICLTNEKIEVIKLECNHHFHMKCIKNCIEHHNTKCPMCRESFV